MATAKKKLGSRPHIRHFRMIRVPEPLCAPLEKISKKRATNLTYEVAEAVRRYLESHREKATQQLG